MHDDPGFLTVAQEQAHDAEPDDDAGGDEAADDAEGGPQQGDEAEGIGEGIGTHPEPPDERDGRSRRVGEPRSG
jgi:hypothetical protein